MYTPTQLEAIRIFGMKDLTDGCIITGLCLDSYGELKERRLCRKTYAGYYLVASHKGNFHDNCGSVHKPSSIEILGHEPHLEDVFRVAKEKDWIVLMDESSISIRKWREKNTNDVIPCIPYKLLINQEDVLTQLINLFKNAT